MDKWTAITIIGFIFAMTLPLSVSVLSNNNGVEMAQAGLEECPIKIDSHNTICVKDCIAYTNMLQKK